MSADPPAADGYLERATLLAELGRYDEAAAELGFALALDPAAAEVSTMLARVHLRGGCRAGSGVPARRPWAGPR